MKDNYNVKYALMEIKEKELLNNGKEVLKTVANIVSKCYLLNVLVNNNTNEKSYEIVFYSGNEKLMNSIMVDNIFDSYEQAVIASNIKNRQILNKNLEFVSINQVNGIILKHDKIVEKYKKLEEKLEFDQNDISLVKKFKMAQN